MPAPARGDVEARSPAFVPQSFEANAHAFAPNSFHFGGPSSDGRDQRALARRAERERESTEALPSLLKLDDNGIQSEADVLSRIVEQAIISESDDSEEDDLDATVQQLSYEDNADGDVCNFCEDDGDISAAPSDSTSEHPPWWQLLSSDMQDLNRAVSALVTSPISVVCKQGTPPDMLLGQMVELAVLNPPTADF